MNLPVVIPLLIFALLVGLHHFFPVISISSLIMAEFDNTSVDSDPFYESDDPQTDMENTDYQYQLNGEVQPYQYEPEIDKPDVEDTPVPIKLEEEPERTNNTEWCRCSVCVTMPTQKECVCCQEIQQVSNETEDYQCITQHPGFEAVCLNKHVLKVAYYGYRQQHGALHCSQNNQYRSTACSMVLGTFGKKIRVVLPSCAVEKIRVHFPLNPGESYMGYFEH